MNNALTLTRAFQKLYNAEPQIYRAPGRVNLIGEHTDYNDGFVMPAAIEYSTWIAIAARRDRRLLVHSQNFSETAELDLDQLPAHGRGHWSDYLFGVAAVLEREGQRLCGADMLVFGDVPMGSGLSSSAAIEVATACSLVGLCNIEIEPLALAKLCQRAENDFVGTRCGIMDQFTSCFGRAAHLLVLDCRALENKFIPLPEHVKLVVCNTMVKHQLAASEYNVRRAECEEAVRLLARRLPGVRSLRDVSIGDFERFAADLPEVIKKRGRHVLTENVRVLGAAEALRRGDLFTVGRLMGESHRSLRFDYEVSCDELDLMVGLACQRQGVFGARMTGGGFGGCTVNLVESKSVDSFKEGIARGYAEATGVEPDIYVFSPVQGAQRVA